MKHNDNDARGIIYTIGDYVVPAALAFAVVVLVVVRPF